MDKIIDAKILLLKDVAWGMRHLPYGYQVAANETTYQYLKTIPRHGFRIVIDNTLEDYVVKFEEIGNVQKDSRDLDRERQGQDEVAQLI